MKENSDGNDTNVGSIENSIEEAKRIIEKLISTMKSDREMFDEKTTEKEIYTFFINALEFILSDYKRVLKINKVLLKENKELKIKNNAIKRESEAYAEHMIRLDNKLNLEKEKSKYEWIRQNCLPQELVNKLYIPKQKVKDKIEEVKEFSENAISSVGLQLTIEVLQELLEGRKI